MFSISFVECFLDGDVGTVFEWCLFGRQFFRAADSFRMLAQVQMSGHLDQEFHASGSSFRQKRLPSSHNQVFGIDGFRNLREYGAFLGVSVGNEKNVLNQIPLRIVNHNGCSRICLGAKSGEVERN